MSVTGRSSDWMESLYRSLSIHAIHRNDCREVETTKLDGSSSIPSLNDNICQLDPGTLSQLEGHRRYGATVVMGICAGFDTGFGRGDELPVDWDKAWSSFRKRGKKSFFSQFKLDKYVSWNPQRSEYPLSEEFDPIKRTERSNLTLWTSPNFTLVGAILVVSLLLIYTLQAPLK
ncbi:hypothetical protein IEQ34_026890 [Dendrobium chrysotoxum]|uniref:Uncharacterized protein n=1 Tax=Dendrobium chrysotoxum TaxID=161865 RepID=A0AAV7FKQ8_DENCH|nr:hypothetical protein IEQ34_026890 [Dendrobium chrysotoxum]